MINLFIFHDHSIQLSYLSDVKFIQEQKLVRHMWRKTSVPVLVSHVHDNLLFCFQMSLRSLAFNAATATDCRSGLSLLHAACVEGDLETV